MKHVLLTGGTGFIGQKITELLVQKGVRVTIIALESEKERVIQSELVDAVFCDLSNLGSLRSMLPKNEFDTVYHLAWAGVSTDYKNDFDLQFKNVKYGMSVMELADYLNCKTVIASGSVSEYAYVDAPVNGKQVPTPADMYGAAKTAVHFTCDLYARQHDMNFRWLLIPSIYGPGREDNNIITYTIKSLLEGQKPEFTKLEQLWDYVYIDDLIKSLYLVGEKGIGSTTYVTGSGVARPLNEYIFEIRDMIDKNAALGVGEVPYKTAKIDNSVVDISALEHDTGYKPEYSFTDGIKNTVDYFRKKHSEK